ncbi:hypothetical protein ES703_123018 [subsurface metagenome]
MLSLQAQAQSLLKYPVVALERGPVPQASSLSELLRLIFLAPKLRETRHPHHTGYYKFHKRMLSVSHLMRGYSVLAQALLPLLLVV